MHQSERLTVARGWKSRVSLKSHFFIWRGRFALSSEKQWLQDRVKYKTKVVLFTMFGLQANDLPGILQTFLEGLYFNYKGWIAELKRQIRAVKINRLNIGWGWRGSSDNNSSKFSSLQKRKKKDFKKREKKKNKVKRKKNVLNRKK